MSPRWVRNRRTMARRYAKHPQRILLGSDMRTEDYSTAQMGRLWVIPHD